MKSSLGKINSVSILWILIRAACVVTVIKMGYQLPFPTFKKCFDWLAKTAKVKHYSPEYIQQTVWAINAVSHRLPFEVVCLPRALALKYLLRQDPRLHLKIGVSLHAGFAAHAWVELHEQVIIGDTPETYQSLWTWTPQ